MQAIWLQSYTFNHYTTLILGTKYLFNSKEHLYGLQNMSVDQIELLCYDIQV